MSEEEKDPVWDKLAGWIGKPLTKGGPTLSPEDVNLPMIRHWIDAMDDRNPIYEDAEAAARIGLDSVVAPPAMLQAWTMPRPILEGIAERGGVPTEIDPDNPINILDEAGFAATLATNSELEFELPKILVDLVDLDLFKSFKPNHDPRTKNRSLNLKIYRSIFFYFMNKEQATSDRVQAKNSQAKRGALINFFYS